MKNKIFSGKGARNNEFILKLLYENGYMSAWNLAKAIAQIDPTRKPKEDVYHKAQKIQSVLVRKGGRLSDLVAKGYLEKTEKGYCLTFNKGFCSALTLYKESIPRPAIDEATKIEAIIPEVKQILDIVSQLYPEAVSQMYSEMRGITLGMLDKGLNFEKISNKEFNDFLAPKLEELQLAEIKKGQNSEKKWEAPPELKEAQKKLVSRLVDIARKQFKELEDLQKKML
jgi:hypothetical protein